MRARTMGMIAAVLSAALLTGCAGTSTDSSIGTDGSGTSEVAIPDSLGAPEVAAPDMVAGGRTGIPTATVERQIVRTGYLSVRVDDVGESAVKVHGLVRARNGIISAEDAQSSGESAYATITAQIPADSLDDFIADVRSLGTVDSVTITAQDVTSQVVDLDARIGALTTSIDRLTQLLAEAERIEDLLAIETQLSARQSELDALTAQRDWLADQVAMSTVTVSLSPLTDVPDVDAPGFLTGLQNGWNAFLALIAVGLTAAGFLVPFILLLALLVVPVTVVLVRRSHRRHFAARETDQP